MDLTAKQFESILGRVVDDKLVPIIENMATKKQVEDLITTVDDLAYKVDSFLTKEWHVHLHAAHPRIERRLKRLEKKLHINQ